MRVFESVSLYGLHAVIKDGIAAGLEPDVPDANPSKEERIAAAKKAYDEFFLRFFGVLKQIERLPCYLADFPLDLRLNELAAEAQKMLRPFEDAQERKFYDPPKDTASED